MQKCHTMCSYASDWVNYRCVRDEGHVGPHLLKPTATTSNQTAWSPISMTRAS